MNLQLTPSEVLHHIERRPGVQGRRAVIKGSRFPVSSIVQGWCLSLVFSCSRAPFRMQTG
jgi:uncharacterized protein (DUF433 family)